MPYYEYRCPSNGRTVEVRHGMQAHLTTWGELADQAGMALDGTPREAPVERLLSAPVPLTGSGSAGGQDFQGCGAGCACARRA